MRRKTQMNKILCRCVLVCGRIIGQFEFWCYKHIPAFIYKTLLSFLFSGLILNNKGDIIDRSRLYKISLKCAGRKNLTTHLGLLPELSHHFLGKQFTGM